MVRKKIDNRIRVMIENGVALGHRSLFVIVGNKARDQVVLLHHMLSKAQVRSRPSVLWCYKSELGFSSHRKKRMRQIQKRMKRGGGDVNEDDPFELFVVATTIRYCYYAETHKILGNTYGMCVLQDFEALTPNLLARTVETVEGGGIVTILLRSMDSLRQLYAMTMDVHSRYRTEAHRNVVGRFNERFILSLASCRTCVVMDDQLNVLPMSSHVLNVEAVPARSKEDRLSERDSELSELVKSLEDTQPLGTLVGCTRTLDQAKALLKFVEAISEKTLRSTVVMTAARGRGKSAALGLAMASAVAFGYSNIFVTSPSPENLKTLFEFVFKGFDALEYQEHLDYDVVQSTNPEFNKAIVRVNIYREHRQTIQYIHPADAHRLGQAELVCIDEAAAIPLPMVKALLGPYLVFMSSTINGYEGTGRSLSLKLVQQLREQTAVLSSVSATAAKTQTIESTVSMTTGRVLHEVELQESVRYRPGDSVEAWLNELLCLNIASVPHIASGCPLPESCELYYVSRDTLFSYHSASEAFLQRLMSIYVSSHYKNTPNDLQMLSDAPAHHLFCMLGPVDSTQNSLPEVLCVLQVSLEGEILKASVIENSARGKRAAGDLIPWTISQQFQDPEFPGLAGGRVVRIATHPDYQGMGYGSRALQLLQKYYEGKFPSLDDPPKETADTVGSEVSNLLEEKLGPRKNLPPLLLKLSERPAERLDYLGVSYGLTSSLLRFWKKAGYTAVYLRQTTNELTGEHSCIMLKQIGDDTEQSRDTWLSSFSADFQRRFLSLLAYQFSKFTPSLALNILPQRQKNTLQELRRADVERDFGDYDLRRLETYARNMADHHVITDLLPAVARLYFLGRLDVSLSIVQQALLLGLGLQHKTVDIMEKEIELPASQLLALFNRTMRKVSQFLNSVVEKAVENEMVAVKDVVMEPLKETMATELDEAAQEFADKQQQEKQKLMRMNLSEYAVAGSEEQWSKALSGSSSSSSKPRNIVSVQSAEGKRKPAVSAETPGSDHRKKHDKGKKKKFKVQH